MKILKKYKEIVFLFVLILISLFLRGYLLFDNLFFGPEQGRDFLVIKDLVLNQKLTLIGPKTDIGGIFHGPLFYYLSAIPFFLTAGNPLSVSWFMILLQSLTIIPLYLLGSRIFNKRAGIIAASLFTISFSAIVYARWLSNPPLSILFVSLFFLSIFNFINGKKIYLVLSAIAFGLAAQVQFLNLIFLAATSIVLFIAYLKKFLENFPLLVASVLLALILSLGNFILFDLRHEFLISNKILALVSGQTGFYSSYTQSIRDGLQTFVEFFAYTVTPPFYFGALGFLILGLIFIRREFSKNLLFLLVWVFVPTLVLMLLRHSILEHFFLFSLPAMILFAAYVLDRVWVRKRVLGVFLLSLVVAVNLLFWLDNIPKNKNIFFQTTQPDLKFSDQKKVIEEIYKRADGRPFSFQSYTIPYWSQQGWEYLFWYYGNQKFGYEPILEKAKLLYVIVQDDPSNKIYQEGWLRDTVSKWGTQTSEFKLGVLTVKELKVD